MPAANTILRDPAHSRFSTLVSDDVSKAHAAVQHLKWVHGLELLQNVESALTFSHDINVHEAHYEFSLQLTICLFCLMVVKISSIDFGILDFSKIFVMLYVI